VRAVILAYHRVARLDSDPQLLAVSPERFAEQLAAIRAAFDPLPLRTLVAALKRGEDPVCVVLTFDDGYRDNLHAAKPLLERHEIPATVFVTSGYVGGSREFWWDDLERIVLTRSERSRLFRLEIGARSVVLDVDGDDRATTKAYRMLLRRLRALRPAEREFALEKLRRWARVPSDPRPSHRALTPDEVVELADGGLVEIGAHTVEHPALAALSPTEQRKEVESSKRALEDVLGREVSLFSYPFGRGRRPRRTYDRGTVSIVEGAGFAAACALRSPAARRPQRFELSRMIVRDWHGDELVTRIERRGGLRRHRRLGVPAAERTSS
jgi:peptidoglycan/xylan/chitin deacetylase (PgdA/CDA1 family)